MPMKKKKDGAGKQPRDSQPPEIPPPGRDDDDVQPKPCSPAERDDRPCAEHEEARRAHKHGHGSEGYTSPDCPPEIAAEFLSNDWCPYCSGKPAKKLRDHFSPPLEDFDAAAVPDDMVEAALEGWRARLAEKNFVVEGCEHCTPRDLLKRVADALDEEHVEMTGGTWHLTAGDECPECERKYAREYETFDWKQRVRDEIAKVKETLGALEEFFEKADGEIASDDGDPRGRLGRLSGLDRLMLIAPCILERLEADIEADRFSLPVGGTGGDALTIVTGLESLERAFNAAITWYERDDVDWAVQLAADAVRDALHPARAIETHSEEASKDEPPPSAPPRTRRPHTGRLFRDLERVSADLVLLRGMLEDFRENRDRRPIHPEDADSRSRERWAEYYREQAMREDPLIAVVEMEGLSKKSLEKGMKLQIESGDALERHFKDEMERHKLEASRDAAFDPEKPVLFLDLPGIPDLAEEDDNDARCDHSCCEDEFKGGWSASVPELAAWEDAEFERDMDTDRLESGREYNYREDPVYRVLDPFLHDLMSATRELDQTSAGDKDEGSSGRSGGKGGEKKGQSHPSGRSERSDPSDKSDGKRGRRRDASGDAGVKESDKAARMRAPLEDYVLLLVMKATARLSSCGVNAEMVDDEAPIHGCHMFAMDNMEKIAKALDLFGPDHLRPFSARAREIASTIRELLGR